MTTQLTLYNNALLLVGERKLSAVDENREARRVLDTVWDRPAIDDCLEQGLWNFAMRSVEVEFSPSVTPAFGYQYAFDRPTDLMRTAALSDDEYFEHPLLDYHVEGAYWYADVSPIYVRYVSNGNEYGYDFDLWPANFTRFVEAYLADGIVERITQDEKIWARVRNQYEKVRTQARSTDAMEQPTTFPPRGAWASSRSGRSLGDRGRRNRLIG